MKIKTLPFTVASLTVLLFLAAVFSVAVINHNLQISNVPAFTYSDELLVYPEATKAQARAEVKPVIPENISVFPLPIIPPAIISRVIPEYPGSALLNGLEGTVILSVLISASGVPINIEINSTSGSADLDAAAQKAIFGWVFEPARSGNSPIESWYKLPVTFKIQN